MYLTRYDLLGDDDLDNPAEVECRKSWNMASVLVPNVVFWTRFFSKNSFPELVAELRLIQVQKARPPCLESIRVPLRVFELVSAWVEQYHDYFLGRGVPFCYDSD